MKRKDPIPAFDISRLERILRRFARARVLVVGDLMLDQFIWGRVERISPEAPVPVVQVTRESFHLGGAANVVHNIRALGGHATACGIIGRDAAGRRVVQELKRIGAGCEGVMAARAAITVRKTRIIAHSQQVVRFDRERTDETGVAPGRLAGYLRRRARVFDAVVVSDYGKGVVTKTMLDALREVAGGDVPLIVDPKRVNFGHYRRVTLATPNLMEAAQASDIQIRSESSLCEAGRRLLSMWEAKAILITRGEEGMTLFTPPDGVRHFPTVARQVFDVTGAGDTVVATCALALAAGATLEQAAFLANHAAGIVVAKVGTAAATGGELSEAIRGRSAEAQSAKKGG